MLTMESISHRCYLGVEGILLFRAYERAPIIDLAPHPKRTACEAQV